MSIADFDGTIAAVIVLIIGLAAKMVKDSFDIQALKKWRDEHQQTSHDTLEGMQLRLEEISRELTALNGYLKGAGVINGHDRKKQ